MSLHIPPTIASPYWPAAAHRAGWHARLRLLSFLAGHSAKAECDRRDLAADYLGGANGIDGRLRSGSICLHFHMLSVHRRKEVRWTL